jgi:hypothetical protein
MDPFGAGIVGVRMLPLASSSVEALFPTMTAVRPMTLGLARPITPLYANRIVG